MQLVDASASHLKSAPPYPSRVRARGRLFSGTRKGLELIPALRATPSRAPPPAATRDPARAPVRSAPKNPHNQKRIVSSLLRFLFFFVIKLRTNFTYRRERERKERERACKEHARETEIRETENEQERRERDIASKYSMVCVHVCTSRRPVNQKQENPH